MTKALDDTAKITNSMYWWLNQRRPFFINDEFMIELDTIDYKRGTVKIVVTNLNNKETKVLEQEDDGNIDNL